MHEYIDCENYNLIKLPLNWDGEILSSIPDEIEGDYYISIRVFADDILISESNEIIIGCSSI
ncbi:MAG: hypothetical protein FWD14_05930 [Treponema sp.]|nr:hypothetical protein [Treponema sp.]